MSRWQLRLGSRAKPILLGRDGIFEKVPNANVVISLKPSLLCRLQAHLFDGDGLIYIRILLRKKTKNCALMRVACCQFVFVNIICAFEYVRDVITELSLSATDSYNCCLMQRVPVCVWGCAGPCVHSPVPNRGGDAKNGYALITATQRLDSWPWHTNGSWPDNPTGGLTRQFISWCNVSTSARVGGGTKTNGSWSCLPNHSPLHALTLKMLTKKTFPPTLYTTKRGTILALVCPCTYLFTNTLHTLFWMIPGARCACYLDCAQSPIHFGNCARAMHASGHWQHNHEPQSLSFHSFPELAKTSICCSALALNCTRQYGITKNTHTTMHKYVMHC